MYYSPIKTAAAAAISIRMPAAEFVAAARTLVRSIKGNGYATDDYGLAACFIPAVFRDASGSGYLAGYCIGSGFDAVASADAPSRIDAAAVYADPESAAIAADLFADMAAERLRAVRPAPTDAELQFISARARAPWLTKGRNVDAIRSACARG